MALDYSKLSDDELEAIANDDYSKLSDRTLRQLTRDPSAQAVPSSEPEVNVAPQATSVGARLIEPAAAVARGVGGVAAGNVGDAYKMANILYKNVTPGVIGEVISSPLKYGKEFASAYVQGHPLLGQIGQTTPQQAIQAGTGFAKNIGGRVLSGAVAPESAVLMPYQMAAYEQEKIRANPNAPEYATNPYAQSYRSQDTATPITQRQAGAMNARNAVANMPTGYTPTPQEARNLLDSGDERTINMYGGRLKLQGLASPGPNAFNSGFAQELNRLGR
jgi:hypothetical protein